MKPSSNRSKSSLPSQPAPSAGTISHLADLVMAGQIVEAAFTDGTFVALMAELNRRGVRVAFRLDKAGRRVVEVGS